MTSCEGCKFWSEMVAESIGLGPIKALCLHEQTASWPMADRMVSGGCADREDGTPIDMPGRR